MIAGTAALARGWRRDSRQGWPGGIRLSRGHGDLHGGRVQAAGVDPSRARRGGACGARSAGARGADGTDLPDLCGPPAAGEPHAEARADRSAHLQRHRQRLLGRDPARGPPVADEDRRGAVRRRGRARCSTRRRRRCRRGSSRLREDAQAESFPRRSRRFATGWRFTAVMASRARSAARPCSGSSTRATRPTTAAAARPAAGCLSDRALSRLLKDDWPRTLDELEAHKARRRQVRHDRSDRGSMSDERWT